MKTTEMPLLQNFHIDGVKYISPPDAMDAVEKGEAVLLDVREINEVIQERIPLDRVINHPMSVIMDRLPYIAKDQNIIVICPGGIRSAKVADLLIGQGYPHVVNLDGGLMLWKAHGLPIESNQASRRCDFNSGNPSKTAFTILKSALSKEQIKSTDFKQLRRI